MNAHKSAQEVVSRYFATIDEYAPHSINVQNHLRGPVQAVTLAIFQQTKTQTTKKEEKKKKKPVEVEDEKHPSVAAAAVPSAEAADSQPSSPSPPPKPPPPDDATTTADKKPAATKPTNNIPDWRDYLLGASSNEEDVPDLGTVDEQAYEALGRRTQARLDACLGGIILAIPDEQVQQSQSTAPSAASSEQGDPLPEAETAAATTMKSPASRLGLSEKKANISLVQGLAGFGGAKEALTGGAKTKTKRANQQKQPPVSAKPPPRNKSGSSTGSSQPSSSIRSKKCFQMNESELCIRLELYIRTCCRVLSQKQECVVAAEPGRALKARARSVVTAFVDTVDTVQQQNLILTRLITCLTQELLAEDVLSEQLRKLIRQLVQDYVQSVSFASLAFLSSPEISAESRLTPMLLQYIKYLQENWEDCIAECELDRTLSLVLDPDLRHTLKTIEFQSIGHLLEVCQGFRNELHHIELPPGMRLVPATDKDRIDEATENADAVRQAIRDLQRETITINGNYLPPVSSRKELVNFLSQTLHSRTLTSAPLKKSKSSSRRKYRSKRAAAAAIRRTDSEYSETSEGELTSGSEADVSGFSSHNDEGSSPKASGSSKRNGGAQRRSRFRLSTVDFLTKRLLLAASRTGTGGDSYFVVRDLFGDEDVSVVPSKTIPTPYGRTARPGSIEIIVKLASITIRCHGSFDVYPSSLIGDVEPLIQLHTTTSETIALQEVRASDTDEKKDISANLKRSDDDSDDDAGPVMVVQERKTERTGWRTLSIRPALYEKYEEFSTPS